MRGSGGAQTRHIARPVAGGESPHVPAQTRHVIPTDAGPDKFPKTKVSPLRRDMNNDQPTTETRMDSVRSDRTGLSRVQSREAAYRCGRSNGRVARGVVT